MRPINTDPLYLAMLNDGDILADPEQGEDNDRSLFIIGMSLASLSGGIVAAAVTLAACGCLG